MRTVFTEKSKLGFFLFISFSLQLFEFIMAIVAVLSVTLLNWLLTMIIYFLVDMEKHTSVRCPYR